jgi:uncharacterized protein
MKELLTRIVKAMVDAPDEVNIIETDNDHTVMFNLKVAKSDIGKVIGKKGRNVQAMRIILNAAAAKNKKRVMLVLKEIIPNSRMSWDCFLRILDINPKC